MLYPTQTKTRSVYSLNGIWKFKQGQNNPQSMLDTDEVMVVPSSFNDIVVDKGKRDFVGDNWYELMVSLPVVSSDEELIVRFGSVTHQAKVYANGQLIGEHKGGFTPFECLLPEELYGLEQFRLTVCANNELNFSTLPVGNYSEEVDENGQVVKKVKENFDFFNYAGIQRNVHLYKRPKVCIEDIVIQSELKEDLTQATVKVDVTVVGQCDTVRVTILDEEGRSLGLIEKDQLVVDSPRLWEVLDAYLYTAKVELFDGERLVDSYSESFGIRSISVQKGQFFINNKPFYFKGFGKHEDTFINGRGLNEAANLMDLNLLKEIGANSFRTSHYPYSEEMMRLADRLGIVVIDEVPAVGLFQNFAASLDLNPRDNGTWSVMETKEAHEQVIRELVARDKNHPCVVMWVVANEPASHEAGAHEYFEPLVQLYRDLDPQSRPVTLVNILLAKPGLDKVMDLVDVISLNRYYGWYVEHGDLAKAEVGLEEELNAWQSLYPDKPILMTEYGADTLPGLHSLWNIPYTEEFQIAYYDMNHRVFDRIPNLIGEQVWNFADFETNVMIFRIQGNHKGLFSRNRQPKQIVGEIKKRWTSIPNYHYKEK
ncbi:beta-glucuronidase [Streptococcus ruminantium]|nr:beta-glucuronidase [Streptococcus ruminantium]MDQ8767355.1 beta-glucuronidase [Streptococcus ruminantium]MDQ8780416.1 beta-glucuronidase [Streptococcus ruminantium]